MVEKFKSIINSGFEKLAGLSFPDVSHTNCDDLQKKVKIVMILPLYGRYSTFLRFLNNYEEVRKFINFYDIKNEKVLDRRFKGL